MTEYNSNAALDWDSTIEEDGESGEYIVLPEGDYMFTVVGFERGHHEGSAKVPPCNMAILRLEVDGPDGPAKSVRRLYLCKNLERMLSDFFRCIGQKQRGTRLTMNWDKVPGARGKAHFAPREHNGRKYNDLTYFIDAPDLGKPVDDPDAPW